ncbi:MAG TPA: PaaI family thioesterase [Dissulfurispiraceae bacterium]|nr:PaaI family thioesterase [Dissulfurispiraceae bacterium]
MQLEDNGKCFVCGKDNPCGLKLSFAHLDGKITSEFTPSALHQGYKDITHEGIITALLDEAMIQAALVEGISPVTAEINVRFKKPLIAGQLSHIEAEIVRKGTRLIEARARLTSGAEGNVIAEGHAKLLIK